LILSSISDESLGVGEGDVGRSSSVSLVVGCCGREEKEREEREESAVERDGGSSFEGDGQRAS